MRVRQATNGNQIKADSAQKRQRERRKGKGREHKQHSTSEPTLAIEFRSQTTTLQTSDAVHKPKTNERFFLLSCFFSLFFEFFDFRFYMLTRHIFCLLNNEGKQQNKNARALNRIEGRGRQQTIGTGTKRLSLWFSRFFSFFFFVGRRRCNQRLVLFYQAARKRDGRFCRCSKCLNHHCETLSHHSTKPYSAGFGAGQKSSSREMK